MVVIKMLKKEDNITIEEFIDYINNELNYFEEDFYQEPYYMNHSMIETRSYMIEKFHKYLMRNWSE